jgi:histidinol-phosphate/aromatic aminotransferase/cobyric acid decarboxylase-like protein
MHYLDRNEYQFELPPRCVEILQNNISSLLTHYSRSFERNTKSGVQDDSKANFVFVAISEHVLPKSKSNFKETNKDVRFFDDTGLKNHFRVSIAKLEINSLIFESIKDAVSHP